MTKKVDLGNPQVIRCLLCYNSLVHALNPQKKKQNKNKNKTKQNKTQLLTYYKTYGITTLKKTCGWG
jgi:hypothetical protein